MAGGRDLHIGLDADDHGFDAAFKDAENSAKGLDRELGRLERQQKLAEFATERSAAAVRRYGRDQDKAALAAKRAGDAAEKAAVRADLAIRRAADAADKLAHGEITEAAAARQAAQAEKAIERSAYAAAAAHRAAGRAADEQADQERQLAREAAVAAAAERLGQLRAAGSIRQHNALLKELRGRFPEIGKSSDSAFKEMERGALSASRLLSSGASLAASAWNNTSLLIKAGIAVLPIAATAAGAGIGLGFGVGLAAIPLVVAAQNEKVKQQFSGLGKYVMSDLKSWSTPFEGVLTRMASRAGDAFDQLGPHLRQAFADLAPMIDQLGAAFIASLGNLGPFIGRMTAAFGPLEAVLSARLPGMVANLTDQLARMAESADPQAFDRLLGGVNSLVSGAGNVVVALERVDQAYGVLEGKSRASVAVQQGQADVWQQIGEKLGIVEPKVSELVPLTNSAASGMRSFGDGAKAAAAALTAWHNAVLGSYNSQIALEQSIDDATKTIKNNGHTLDINTQKGRENKSALLAIGAAALKAADDAKKSGADSSAAMNRGYNAFIKAARGAGMTRSAAAALARQIGLVPSAKSTNFRTNAGAVRGQVAALQAAINRVHGKSVTIEGYVRVHPVRVNVGGGQSVLIGSGRYAKGGRVGYVSRGKVHSVPAFPSGGQVRGAGTGTSDSNLIAASKGEFVVNAKATARNLPALEAINAGMFQISKAVQRPPSVARPLPPPARAAGGGVMQVNVNLGGQQVASVLIDPLKGEIRKRGGKGPGSVQTALGYS